MFAVPGWSVSSTALKTQTSNAFLPEIPQIGESKPTSKVTGKRKRANRLSKASQVDPENLAHFWETVVEKRGPRKRPRVTRKHDEKRQKEVEDNTQCQKSDTGCAVASDKEELDLTRNWKAKGDKRRKKKARLQSSNSGANEIAHTSISAPVTQLTRLQSSMRQKLISARFRHLNQTLYTTSSVESLKLFEQDPEMFHEYHEGFRRQVEVWPENPVDGYIAQIRQRGKLQGITRNQGKIIDNQDVEQNGLTVMPLPRTEGICYIADLGCGDATLSTALDKEKNKIKIQVFSYDLQCANSLVTKADIADLPLEDGSVDVAIFCLALMGTNWVDFIEEAFRILRWKGELWITEIRSRFSRVGGKQKRVGHSVGLRKNSDSKSSKELENADDIDLFIGVDHDKTQGETDISTFVEVLRKRGFILRSDMVVDLRNRMFVNMTFLKSQTPIKGKCVPAPKGSPDANMVKTKFFDDQSSVSSESTVLKPCVYKLR